MEFRGNKNMCPISLTENAVSYLRDILETENQEDLRLRVYVSGGGCSGLQYGMALDTEVDPDDSLFEYDGIKIVLGVIDIKYLDGSVVDYVTTPLGGGFKVDNPKAVKACGCGGSFSVEDDVAGRTLTGGCGSCSR
jgi:iron-sulfur cluster assembly protein